MATKKKTKKEANPVGRPPMFKNAEELHNKIVEYFETKKEAEESPTISGLVLHCGFSDRASFYDYEKKPEFTHTVKKARLTMEMVYETYLLKGNHTAGAIFALKNFGWSDKQEIEHGGQIDQRHIYKLPEKK